jgi:hypothetical protein
MRSVGERQVSQMRHVVIFSQLAHSSIEMLLDTRIIRKFPADLMNRKSAKIALQQPQYLLMNGQKTYCLLFLDQEGPRLLESTVAST